MPTLQDLKSEYTALALKAHEIVADESISATEVREALDKIEGKDRGANGEEIKPEPGTLKALSAQIADAEYLAEVRKNYGGITNGKDAPEPEGQKAHHGFSGVVDLEAFQEQLARFKVDGRINTGPLEIKNTTFVTTGLTDPDVIAPTRRPGVLPILFERLTIADLMPNSTMTGNTFRAVVESLATNAASTVAEGATKPEGAFNFDVVDEPARKIAVVQKVADEALEDMEWLQLYLSGRLALFVRIEEEKQLLRGNSGTTSTNLMGILNRTGLTTAEPVGSETYSKIALAVHREITKVRVASFLDPDALVFHPNDWQAARFEADANGQFFGGGPFTGQYGNGGIAGDVYWGLRTVVTQSMTENTILLGAFAMAAEVVRRKGLTVDMTNSDQNDFIKNLVTLRAEERLALAVYRPSAFGTVTGA